MIIYIESQNDENNLFYLPTFRIFHFCTNFLFQLSYIVLFVIFVNNLLNPFCIFKSLFFIANSVMYVRKDCFVENGRKLHTHTHTHTLIHTHTHTHTHTYTHTHTHTHTHKFIFTGNNREMILFLFLFFFALWGG